MSPSISLNVAATVYRNCRLFQKIRVVNREASGKPVATGTPATGTAALACMSGVFSTIALKPLIGSAV